MDKPCIEDIEDVPTIDVAELLKATREPRDDKRAAFLPTGHARAGQTKQIVAHSRPALFQRHARSFVVATKWFPVGLMAATLILFSRRR